MQQPYPIPLDPLQLKALQGLLDLAQATYFAMDDAAQLDDMSSLVDEENANVVCNALDALDELPDDRPGYTMSGPAKARWALRALIGGVS